VVGNAERRAEILAQHGRLRRMVHSLLDTAARLPGDESEAEILWEQFATLRFALAQHLLDEEDLLEPIFARSDGTGAPLLVRMNVEHARQRATLSLLPSHRPRDAAALRTFAEIAAGMGRALLAEMDEEEEQLLSFWALGPSAKPHSGPGTP